MLTITSHAQSEVYEIQTAQAFGYYGDDLEGAREFMISVRAQIKETNAAFLAAVNK